MHTLCSGPVNYQLLFPPIYQALTLNVLVKDKMCDKLIPTISISKDMTKRAYYAYDDDYVNVNSNV